MIPWLAILSVSIGLILAVELYAYFTSRTTLSQWVADVTAVWPRIIPFGVGLVVGGLAVHFWLPWCPS